MTHYPKTQQAANRFSRKFHQHLQQFSKLTEVGIVADVSFALTQGYVTVTSLKGPVRVVGAGLGTLIPGMRIFLRPMTGNVYIFDGLAPMPLTVGTEAGSLVYTGLGTPAASTPIQTSMPTVSIPSGPGTGWYFSFFFYLSALPAPGASCVLLDLPKINTSSWTAQGGWRVTYDYLGRINVYPYGSAYGNPAIPAPTTQTFSPHRVWFLTAQIGNGLAINGIQTNGALAGLNAMQTVLAGNYGMFLLSDATGGSLPANGSWISKVSFGSNFAAGFPVWPYNLSSFVPSADSQIANGSKALGAGLHTYLCYLCRDTGLSTLTDTASGLTLSVAGSVLATGPY